jgi:GNAT superfamily N-acetyltransferase
VVDIGEAPFDGPEGRALTAAYHAELRRRFPEDYDPARGLPALSVDLAPPIGVFLVVHDDNEPVGCGALKTLDTTTGEVKHMFVHPGHRGQGVGRLILETIEHHARQRAFHRLVLDTSEYLTEAIALYQRAGYVLTDAYNTNHYATHWFAKDLAPDA